MLPDVPLCFTRYKTVLSQALATVVILSSLGAVLLSNLPYRFEKVLDRVTDSSVPFAIGSALGGLRRITRAYADRAGLNARWEMFSQQQRYNWWFFIKARYADSSTEVLPLARQAERTFWQNTFFDLKEAKLYQNLRESLPGRMAYARYLCRQYAFRNGVAIRAIEFEFHSQEIVPIEQALSTGSHLSRETLASLQDTFECENIP